MEPSTARTAVLLDHHPLWLEAVEPVLARIEVQVVGKATIARDALALLEQEQPDLFVTEIAAPEGTAAGIACLRQAQERIPNGTLIVLGGASDPDTIDAAFAAGARAYIVKTAHPEDIAATIRQAFNHSIFFAQMRPVREATNGSARGSTSRSGSHSPGLTRREVEILQLVAEGHSNGQLARMLWVTEQTVKFHLSNIYRKLDVRNRTEASRWAQLNGVVSATRTAVAQH
jgi:DNA-binding NarL/FixJ family response regulator